MNRMRMLALSCAGLGAAAALGGCVDDGYGGGVALGYGAPRYDAYYDGYGEPGWYGDGFAGGYPGYYGWYGGFYYPGTGLYVYDRDRRPYRWNGGQRRYWQGQQRSFQASAGAQGFRGSANWGGFDHGHGGGGTRPAGQAFRGGAPHAGAPHAGATGGGRHR